MSLYSTCVSCMTSCDVIIKCHRLNGLNNRNLLLAVVEAGSPSSRCNRVGFR
jgi:hypothetical protein